MAQMRSRFRSRGTRTDSLRSWGALMPYVKPCGCACPAFGIPEMYMVRFGVGAPQLSDLWGDFGVFLDVASPQRLKKGWISKANVCH